MLTPFLLYLSFLFSSAYAVEVPSDQWMRLLRYNKQANGHLSEVDSLGFFLSPKGRRSPHAELKIANKIFQQELKSGRPQFACHFPARFLFLMGHSKSQFLNPCSEFALFRRKHKLESVSVIFSSYFLKKPASAFGHTLFKLNSSEAPDSDLRSYGVDYAAQVDTANPLLYGLKGIMGGFYGQFGILPYFLKLREYNDYESRDLFEFKINLTRSELDLFVAHLWEMRKARFQYFYFTENCSYHIMRFLDAIAPRHDLWAKVDTFLVPIDTVVALMDSPSAVKEINFRPSLDKRVGNAMKSLKKRQKKRILGSLNNKKLISSSLTGAELDVLMDLVDLLYPQQLHLGRDQNDITNFKQEILLRRASLPLAKNAVPKLKQKLSSFDYGHRSRRLTLERFEGSFQGLLFEHRFALHALEEPQGDLYGPFGLEMGKTRLRVFDDSRVRLESFELARVEKFTPYLAYDPSLSWKISLGAGARTLQETRISEKVDLGLGLSARFQGALIYGLAEIRSQDRFSKTSGPLLTGVNLGMMHRVGHLSLRAEIYPHRELEQRQWDYHSDLKLWLSLSDRYAAGLSFRRFGEGELSSLFASFYL